MDVQKWTDGGGVDIFSMEDALANLLGVTPGKGRARGIDNIEVDRAGWAALGAAAATLRVELIAVLDHLADYMRRWYRHDPKAIAAWFAARKRAGARGPWDQSAYRVPVRTATLHKFGNIQGVVGGDSSDNLGFDLVAYAIGDPDVMRKAIAAHGDAARGRR